MGTVSFLHVSCARLTTLQADQTLTLTPFRTAAITVIGTWLGAASTSNFISGMVLSIIQFIYPEYVIHSWHKYLVYVAIIVAGALLNILGARILPAFNRFICRYLPFSRYGPFFSSLFANQTSSWVLFDDLLHHNHHDASVLVSKLQFPVLGIHRHNHIKRLGQPPSDLYVVLCE